MKEAMLPIVNNQFFVITGGPGTGKTTLLNALEVRQFDVVAEIARQLIKEQVDTGGEALPWSNTDLYKQLMFDRSVESYRSTSRNKKKITFFDRGIPDTLAYARLIHSAPTAEMDFYARNYRYSKKVFMLPPWFSIYQTDKERKQRWDEAVLTYNMLKETYMLYGYQLIEVPQTPVEERVHFVLDHIDANDD